MKTVLIFIQIITQYTGDFCESSWSFQHAHLYLTIFDIVFVGGALGATIRFARRVGSEVAPVHKPRAKIWCFLGIVVFQLFQNVSSIRPVQGHCEDTNLTLDNLPPPEREALQPYCDRHIQRHQLWYCIFHDLR